jgi:hypothetical protein
VDIRDPVTVSVGMGLTSGPSVGLAVAQGQGWGFFRPWLTERVGELCPSIQPPRTRRVIKSPTPPADINKDATPESGLGTRTGFNARWDLMD